jgi:hypothetical protein
VQYAYYIHKPGKRGMGDKLYDPTCQLYEITRKTLNVEEAKAAGHDEWSLRGGGMLYIWNSVTHKIVSSVGGGTVYIGSAWPLNEDGADDEAFDLIGEFLVERTAGGDITEIVNEFLAKRRASGK